MLEQQNKIEKYTDPKNPIWINIFRMIGIMCSIGFLLLGYIGNIVFFKLCSRIILIWLFCQA